MRNESRALREAPGVSYCCTVSPARGLRLAPEAGSAQRTGSVLELIRWKSVARGAKDLWSSKGRPDHGISGRDKKINLRKTMAYQPLYTAVATATGGRDGHVESSDGIVKLDLSVPREMGGPGKPGTSNPEQLFASGYSACFAGAIGFVANQQHKKLGDVQVTAHVTFGKVDEQATYAPMGRLILCRDLHSRSNWMSILRASTRQRQRNSSKRHIKSVLTPGDS